ncbi:mevalonate kinase [Martensiomyces pterosporus]|nr:mevalonate kinase [Martensiomyces pterosporus]
MAAIAPDWSPFVVSAPGKVILFGEHAVVYGKAAIAGSLNLRAYALVTPRVDQRVRLVLPDISVDALLDIQALPLLNSDDLEHPGDVEPLVRDTISIPEGPGRTAVLTFIYLYGCLFSQSSRSAGFTICVRSLLPVGAGLGSSASFNVALSAALLRLTGWLQSDGLSAEDKKLINTWAFRGEQVAHGTPSGIDNSVATYGGFVLYQRGHDTVDLQSKHALRVLITNTNVPKSTKALIAGVRALKDKYPSVVDGILDNIHSISTSAADLFRGTDQVDVQELETQTQDIIRINHGLLYTLGVSHPSLERIREVTAVHGMASKLTGAGGGGCALTLIPHNVAGGEVEAVSGELAEEGFECYETVVGGPGVTITRSVGAAPVEQWVSDMLDQHISLTRSDRQDVSADAFGNIVSGFVALPESAISRLSLL